MVRVAALLVLLLAAGCGTVEAGRLLRDAVGPAAALATQVEESDVALAGVAARTYRPRDRSGELPAVLLCHGAQENGFAEPRLVAFARALAIRGFVVATPDLATLRSFRIDARDPERIARMAAALADRVALVGISVGGAYCILAAARSELRGRVSCVLSLGAYADMAELLRAWMAEPQDKFIHGRRQVMYGNLDRLAPPADRAHLRRTLRALLDGKRPPPPPATLSAAGRRLLEAARSREPLDAELLAPLAGDLAALTPRTAPAAPVFVLHGAGDPIIPPAHAARLGERMGARVHVTDLFAHADLEGSSPGYFEARPLLRFTARFLRAARR